MPNHAQAADAPVYGIRPQKPGMYLGLFHGRKKPDQAMSGWGLAPHWVPSFTFTPPTLAA